jgi:chemotaxis protein methyltransferase CheR
MALSGSTPSQNIRPELEARTALSHDLFEKLGSFIYETCGIKMPQTKKTMLEARLLKRIRALGFASFGEYCGFLFSPDGKSNELVHMIDAVTTNKTDFFREPQHFDYLLNKAIPDLIRSQGAGIRRTLMAWSAACSSGEEPYTLAMVLEEYAKKTPGFHSMVLATDISTKMLEKAKDAIYDEERIVPVPIELRRRYFMRSKDPKNKAVRVIPDLRSKVRFRWLNFMNEDFGLREKMDIIFCRNVLIYFDRSTQEKVVDHLCRHLAVGGYLFTGHSETLSGMDLPLETVANTISRRI